MALDLLVGLLLLFIQLLIDSLRESVRSLIPLAQLGKVSVLVLDKNAINLAALKRLD
jgi:hypothetical protein